MKQEMTLKGARLLMLILMASIANVEADTGSNVDDSMLRRKVVSVPLFISEEAVSIVVLRNDGEKHITLVLQLYARGFLSGVINLFPLPKNVSLTDVVSAPAGEFLSKLSDFAALEGDKVRAAGRAEEMLLGFGWVQLPAQDVRIVALGSDCIVICDSSKLRYQVPRTQVELYAKELVRGLKAGEFRKCRITGLVSPIDNSLVTTLITGDYDGFLFIKKIEMR